MVDSTKYIVVGGAAAAVMLYMADQAGAIDLRGSLGGQVIGDEVDAIEDKLADGVFERAQNIGYFELQRVSGVDSDRVDLSDFGTDFKVVGGSDKDEVITGSGDDIFELSADDGDKYTGGEGSNTYRVTDAFLDADGSKTRITDFDSGKDQISMRGINKKDLSIDAKQKGDDYIVSFTKDGKESRIVLKDFKGDASLIRNSLGLGPS